MSATVIKEILVFLFKKVLHLKIKTNYKLYIIILAIFVLQAKNIILINKNLQEIEALKFIMFSKNHIEAYIQNNSSKIPMVGIVGEQKKRDDLGASYFIVHDIIDPSNIMGKEVKRLLKNKHSFQSFRNKFPINKDSFIAKCDRPFFDFGVFKNTCFFEFCKSYSNHTSRLSIDGFAFTNSMLCYIQGTNYFVGFIYAQDINDHILNESYLFFEDLKLNQAGVEIEGKK
jgi:hypothetical protein